MRYPRRRRLGLPLATAASLALLAAPAQATHHDHLLPAAGQCAEESTPGAPRTDQRAAMRCLTNHARVAAGLKELSRSMTLGSSAADKAYDIMECQEFEHEACGLAPDHWIIDEGYVSGCGAWGAAENIGWGSGGLGAAREQMSGWLHSDVHRTNLLNPKYREHGVGIVQGSFLGRGDAQIWVHHFGYCD
jgi:uncharacterized protein YkwD